jgi:hypothetical protein
MAEFGVQEWLQRQCRDYEYDLRGAFRIRGTTSWPLVASDSADLEAKLSAGGHLLPLPKEPAALANVLEVSIVDFLLERISSTGGGLSARRGAERSYPDLEISGPAVRGAYYAVDVKCARRHVTKRGKVTNRTQSRITLYTGNTYFKFPSLSDPGTFRPFADYAQHVDIIAIYTFDDESAARVRDLELVVQEPWRIGSRQRSSTTREYIGAVTRIDDLRAGKGEFATEEEFYAYWRRYKFRVGDNVAKRLEKVLKKQQ